MIRDIGSYLLVVAGAGPELPEPDLPVSGIEYQFAMAGAAEVLGHAAQAMVAQPLGEAAAD
ncbi:hypothetical protein [Zobellella endophytica]|uniref:hypothetical protein n=1 Tax=Zobellella endophytica TaxID=2116700 RepID=UPI0011B21D53|nr:hypothetical protein [Zobellella endophytica]